MSPYFDVADHGAKADPEIINTKAIQNAIDACHDAGGGRVFLGAGRYVTGTLRLKSHVELHLGPGCTLQGSSDLEDYPDFTAEGLASTRFPERTSKSLICADHATDIAITGPGQINGSGRAFYGQLDEKTGKYPKPDTPRPRLLMFYACENVRIEDVSLVESACWTVWLMQCQTVHVHRLKVRGDRRMRNNDGIDVDACRDVTISDSIFNTEDDCIVLRAIQKMYESPAICENVTVSNCLLNSNCQGVRIGCPNDGTIRHCTFSNLVIESERSNGITIDNPKRYFKEQSPTRLAVHDILFTNVSIRCGRIPIKIVVEEGIGLSRLSDLRFSDMHIRSGQPCIVQGSTQTTIRKVDFSNIRLETTGDNAIICRHVDDVGLTNVRITSL